jgi:hypothetical protein
MFAPPAPVADVQITALCEVAADPARFAGRPITVRGAVAQPSPEVPPSLSDESCGLGLGLSGVSPEDADRLRPNVPVSYATVTGTVAFARCAGRLGAGTGCGAYLRVSRVETATVQTAQR